MTEQNDQELSGGDYLRAIKRRAGVLYAIVGTVFLIGVAIAYRVPPIYESTGVLLAEAPEVPEYVVRSTIPDYPEERVRIVTQRVLTNDNLERIVQTHALYPDLADTGAALREFRDHLTLSSEDPQILENLMGANLAAGALAFSLTFGDRSPALARDVTRDLVALYLEENQRARQEQAAGTTRFLTQEAKRLEAELSEREMVLAEFKERNSGNLPDIANTNLQLLDRVERDLQATEQEIRSLRERQSLFSSELAQLSPQATIVNEDGATILSSQDRLKLLQRRYVQLSAVYSQDHPDVLAVSREIEALSASTGMPAFDRESLQAALVAREQQLAAARDRYSDDHPDVRRLERTLESLRAAYDRAPRASTARSASFVPDNPQYIQRQVQLQAIGTELNAATTHRDQLRARLSDLEGRLSTAPSVEREYNSLARGHEQLLAQYNDTQRKLREAEISQNLESESRGDRFTVLERPGLPSSPAQPNRLAVLLLTLVVAVALGAGGVAVAEHSDTSVRGAEDIKRYLEIPPLVAIPFVYNQADRRRLVRNRLITATAACAWLGVIGFFIMTPAG
jgi:uncharacterized protein involved in exopolysaccharide biosynthesis